MNGRLKVLGIVVAIMGIGFLAGGGYAYYKTTQGTQALQAFSAAQNVKLTYNADGQLADNKGDTTEAVAIMGMLANDWGYTVDKGELNPNDPVVNTTSEYMYQMATIAYHTLHAATTVVLDKDVTAPDGTLFKAGSYEFKNDGRYWTGFDRNNAIEAAARGQIWTPTAHALIGELGVGSATASALLLATGMAAILAGVGLMFLITGLGLVWVARAGTERVKAPVLRPAATAV